MYKIHGTAVAAMIFGVLMYPGCLIAEEEVNTCLECHSQLEDGLLAPAQMFESDVHNRQGLMCVGCHGGDDTADDPEEAMSEAKGFIGAPTPFEIPKLCSKCHSDPAYMKTFDPLLPTDQYSKYLTSIHGERNKEGDKKVAQCASCHRAHDIRAADDPKSSIYAVNIPSTCSHCHSDADYMAEYKIPTNQMALYSKSVHGVALLDSNDVGAPACNDCHGNHGAIPPGVSSIERVCGLCHESNMTFFEQSTHFEYFRSLDSPACETCHGNHSISKPTTAMLGGEHSVCAQCHSRDDGTGGLAAADTIKADLDSLNHLIDVVTARLDTADQKGLYVTNALFTLKDARQKSFEARTAVHMLETDSVKAITAEGDGIAVQANAVAIELLKDYLVRRIGLAVSVIILCFLALLIWLKVRQIEARQKLR